MPSITNATFGVVIEELFAKRRMARTGWNGKGMYIQLMEPAPGNAITLPFIAMYTAAGELVPWVAPHTDMLSADWFSVE